MTSVAASSCTSCHAMRCCRKNRQGDIICLMKKVYNVELPASAVVAGRILAVIAVVVAFVCEALAWDVEHDEVAQLTGEFLPKEVKATFHFDDFAILMANCHFPDQIEWPMEDGKRRFHTFKSTCGDNPL